VDAVSNVLASQAFKNLGDDKREIVSGYADFVKGELDKPNPDASKVKSWIEKMQLALTTANLMAEAGTIGMALAAFLGS
jgi:O-glycosyl hydrolase